MKTLLAGGNLGLQGHDKLSIHIRWSPKQIAGHDVDCSAFLVDSSMKVRSDADFIFYNQPASENSAVQLQSSSEGQDWKIDLAALPNDVSKVVFAVTIHGNGNFSQAQALSLVIDGILDYHPAITNMSESALVLGELYLRNGVWKFRAVGQGFAGGLGPLATRYGVDIGEPDEEPPTPDSTPQASPPASNTPAKLSLEKKLLSLEKSAPQLVSLAKKAQLSLKKKGLDTHTASVALMMDVSGSMSGMFWDGTVQSIIERVMGLGLNFDDNGAIDIFAFQSKAYDLGELLPANFRGASQWILKQVRMGGTSYAPAVNTILSHYGYLPKPVAKPQSGGFFGSIFGSNKTPEVVEEAQLDARLPAKHPVYVLFVTDGDCSDRQAATQAIKAASKFPVFFQFVGIGGASLSFLEELDDMPGRYVDNADFFAVRQPKSVKDEWLYNKMTDEYPKWIKEARSKGLIQ